jgi:hypothetical protein
VARERHNRVGAWHVAQFPPVCVSGEISKLPVNVLVPVAPPLSGVSVTLNVPAARLAVNTVIVTDPLPWGYSLAHVAPPSMNDELLPGYALI